MTYGVSLSISIFEGFSVIFVNVKNARHQAAGYDVDNSLECFFYFCETVVEYDTCGSKEWISLYTCI